VSPRDDNPSKNPSGDDLDDALLDCLAQIRRELQAASRGEELGDDGDGLVDAAASLDSLVDRIVQDASAVEHADLDAIVDRCAKDLVHSAKAPIAVRQTLLGRLPKVACKPDELAHAVRRALELCVGNTGHGGEIEIRTQNDGDNAVLELRSSGSGAHVVDRALTLRAFAATCGGRCKVETERTGAVHLSLAFPFATARR
jgi:hypothetical protein